MINIFKIFGIIEINGIDKANSKLSAFANAAGKVATKISKGLVKTVEAAGVAFAASATALGTLTVKAVNMAGELEQNLGGSEAVFQEYAESMQEIASDAFKNMGLSTSDYLATANKMGSLFKGAGFEVKDAMNLTTQAMQRAADVASIMGIDISSAMESIAGAAKGNFTMMDNLGVAMNDTNLQAYALSRGIEKATSEMTQQEKIGLAMQMFLDKTADYAGNYAKENETLAGSLNTAKAALDNFLSGAGDADSVVEAAINAFDVIEKNVSDILPKLVRGINTLIKKLSPKIAPMVKSLLPEFVSGVITLLRGITSESDKIIDVIINDCLPPLVDGIISIVEIAADKLPRIVEKLIPALVENVLKLVWGAVKAIVGSIPEMLESLSVAFDGVIVAIGEFLGATDNAYESQYNFTVALRDNASAVEDAAAAHKGLAEEYDKSAGATLEETQRLENLWGELQTLVDENGNVLEADKGRVDFILGALNDALGTEYTMNGNIIEQYQQMQSEIDKLIEKRRAESLLSNYDSLYTTALEDKSNLEADRNRAENLYEQALQRRDDALAAYQAYQEKVPTNKNEASDYNLDIAADLYQKLSRAESDLADATNTLAKAEGNLNEALADIYRYETASGLIASGEYEAAIYRLVKATSAGWDALKNGQEVSAETRDALLGDLQDMERNVDFYYRQMQNGVEGYTKAMYEAELNNFLEAVKIWENATGEAYTIGENIAKAMATGIADNLEAVKTTAINLTGATLNAMRIAAQIESPSKIARAFGRFISDGLALGITDEAETAQKAAADTMSNTLEEFENTRRTNDIFDAVSAMRMRFAGRNSSSDSATSETQELRESVAELVRSLPDMIADAISGMRLTANNRELARVVRTVK